MKFEQRIIEFLNIETYDKFERTGGVLFEDGINASTWFSSKKKKILSLKTEEVKQIKNQFNEYKKLKRKEKKQNEKEAFERRLAEFIEIEDIYKFSVKRKVKFKDGLSTRYWFIKEKEKIFKSKEPKCKEVKKQYNLFLISIPDDRTARFNGLYEKKLLEFANEENLQKFSAYSDIKFEDGKLMHNWYALNKDKIFSSKDELCLKIAQQHESYKKTFDEERERNFLNKLEFFVKLNDLGKFARRFGVKFPDGASCGDWFSANKKRIFELDNNESLLITLQYEEYKQSLGYNNAEFKLGTMEVIKSRKKMLQEFADIKSLDKFERDTTIVLPNGQNAYDYFSKSCIYILESKDPICVEIKEQYEELQNKRKIKNTCEFKKDELYFYKSKNKYKFNIYSEEKLPSGISCGLWFKYNMKFILKSKGPIELKIKEQYKNYLAHSKLILEFYHVNDLSKFDFDSDYKFSTGALMSMWWEVNSDAILNDEFFLCGYIKEQYNLYIGNSKKFEKK